MAIRTEDSAGGIAVLTLAEMSHRPPLLVVLSYLFRFVPYKRAFELATGSRRTGAVEAEAGVVMQVVPTVEAVARAMKVARGMVAHDPRPVAPLSERAQEDAHQGMHEHAFAGELPST